MPGAMHRGLFDDWYPGFVDHVNSFRNTVSFLTETALYRYATPHFYTVDEFPRERQDLRTEVLYASPWRGGWWRLRDAVNIMIGASMAVLDTAAKNREELLFNRYQAGRDVVQRFSKDPPYAYVIPSEQRDLPTAAVLVEKLLINGIEVHQATGDFKANGSTYKSGSWVVLMDQPFAALVKELFSVQKYPDLRQAVGPAAAAPGAAGGAAAGGGRGGGGRGAQAPAAGGGAGGGRGAGAGATAPTAAPWLLQRKCELGAGSASSSLSVLTGAGVSPRVGMEWRITILPGPTRTSLTSRRTTRWRSSMAAVAVDLRSVARKPSRFSASLR